jgi:methylthioribulose-1-phosphate dehydratase
VNLRSIEDPRELLAALLQSFHRLGWVSGTGGGICGTASSEELWVAPTGVHKELVRPDEFFRIQIESGDITSGPENLKPSECAPIFRAICRARGAGSVVHSHALSAVLAADRRIDGVTSISGFEMLKGLGLSNTETLEVPVIENTEREHELTGAVEEVLRSERFANSPVILVADHGAYLWGSDPMEAKKHAEVLHWLFEGLIARSK